MSEEFDTQALRQWADWPVPSAGDPKRHAYWNQMRSDLVAAADYIEELEKIATELCDLNTRLVEINGGLVESGSELARVLLEKETEA